MEIVKLESVTSGVNPKTFTPILKCKIELNVEACMDAKAIDGDEKLFREFGKEFFLQLDILNNKTNLTN